VLPIRDLIFVDPVVVQCHAGKVVEPGHEHGERGIARVRPGHSCWNRSRLIQYVRDPGTKAPYYVFDGRPSLLLDLEPQDRTRDTSFRDWRRAQMRPRKGVVCDIVPVVDVRTWGLCVDGHTP